MEVFLCHLKRVAIITTRSVINSIYAEIIVLNGNTKTPDDAVRVEHHLCHLAHQIRYQLILKRHYWSIVEVLRWWRLGPMAISWNVDVPWPDEVKQKLYLESCLRLHFKFDSKAFELTEIYDGRHRVKRSYIHRTRVRRWTSQIGDITVEYNAERHGQRQKFN